MPQVLLVGRNEQRLTAIAEQCKELAEGKGVSTPKYFTGDHAIFWALIRKY